MTLIPDALALVRELIPNSASQLFLHAERAPEDLREANVLGVLPTCSRRASVRFPARSAP